MDEMYFYYEIFPSEIQAEISQRFDELTRALIALTSRRFLAQTPHKDRRNTDTILTWAAQEGSKTLIEELLTRFGWSGSGADRVRLLRLAFEKGNVEVVTWFLTPLEEIKNRKYLHQILPELPSLAASCGSESLFTLAYNLLRQVGPSLPEKARLELIPAKWSVSSACAAARNGHTSFLTRTLSLFVGQPRPGFISDSNVKILQSACHSGQPATVEAVLKHFSRSHLNPWPTFELSSFPPGISPHLDFFNLARSCGAELGPATVLWALRENRPAWILLAIDQGAEMPPVAASALAVTSDFQASALSLVLDQSETRSVESQQVPRMSLPALRVLWNYPSLRRSIIEGLTRIEWGFLDRPPLEFFEMVQPQLGSFEPRCKFESALAHDDLQAAQAASSQVPALIQSRDHRDLSTSLFIMISRKSYSCLPWFLSTLSHDPNPDPAFVPNLLTVVLQFLLVKIEPIACLPVLVWLLHRGYHLAPHFLPQLCSADRAGLVRGTLPRIISILLPFVGAEVKKEAEEALRGAFERMPALKEHSDLNLAADLLRA